MKLVKRVAADVAVIVFIMSVHPVAAEPCPATAQSFWKNFRQAVIEGNMIAITKHVHFPFMLRGTLDSSDTKRLTVDEFKAAFPTLISTDPGLSAEPSTMKILILKTRALTPRNCNPEGNQFDVGTWTFQLTPKGWQLSKAYTDD